MPARERMRPAFKVRTEQADTFVVRHRGKRRILRIHRTMTRRDQALADYYTKLIFHLLYPANSIKPVGVRKVEGKRGKERFGVLTDIAGPRSVDYKRFHQFSYDHDLRRRYHDGKSGTFFHKDAMKSKERAKWDAHIDAHLKFINEIGFPLGKKIWQESGFLVNYGGVNIGNVNETPIYFEPKLTRPRVLAEAIKRQPAGKRKRLEECVKQLRRLGMRI